jgi:citrate lyase beta subunit
MPEPICRFACVNRALPLLAMALLVVSPILVACGGDNDSSDGGESSAGTISKDEFIEQADAICADSADAQQEVQADLEAAASPEEAAAAYEQLAELSQGVNDEINALGRPEGDEELIDDLAAKQDDLVGMVLDLADAIRAQDQAAVEEVSAELDDLLGETAEISEAYGFEVC